MTEKIKSWPPTRYTGPLVPADDNPDVPKYSDGYWLLKLVDLCYRLPDGSPIQLDYWQRCLILAALEKCPPGHARAGRLRYRQVFVSVARQNGKSVLGAIFALYGLIREAGALVIGLASSADQATIIYQRVLTALKSHPNLASRFTKTTETRGIASKDGSRYLIKAAKSAAVQGLDASLGIIDELHITPAELWSDLLSGSAARKNGLVFGITTAGDDNSALLLDLYEKAATGNHDERFGFFIWEAPEARVPDDDATLGLWLQAASPALAEGRIDVQTAISDVRSMAETDAIRYRLNRFVRATSNFLPLARWQEALSTDNPPLDNPVFCLQSSKEKDWFTVVAAQTIDGVTYAEVVAQLPTGDLAKQLRFAEALHKFNPARYVVNRYTLGGLIEALHKRGYNVSGAASGDQMQGSAHLFHLLASGKLKVDASTALTQQALTAQRKNVGEHFKIVAPEEGDVDILYALAFACLYAEIESQEATDQLYF